MHDISKMKIRMINVKVSLLNVSFSPTMYLDVLCRRKIKTIMVMVMSEKSIS